METREGPILFDSRIGGRSPSVLRLVALGAISAVLFGLSLLLTESVGEVAVDVDLKLFFVPYLLIGLFRYGTATLSVGLGAALGEGLLDVAEGYELDDPIGFLGYVVGFTAFGWYLSEVAADPTSARSLLVAGVFGAFVQALFEVVAFLAFEPTAGIEPATISLLGNTFTHGVALGAVPLVVLVPRLRAWLEVDGAATGDR